MLIKQKQFVDIWAWYDLNYQNSIFLITLFIPSANLTWNISSKIILIKIDFYILKQKTLNAVVIYSCLNYNFDFRFHFIFEMTSIKVVIVFLDDGRAYLKAGHEWLNLALMSFLLATFS